MVRRYAPHRRAYYPNPWPLLLPVSLAVGAVVWSLQLHTLLGVLAVALGGGLVGAAGAQVQWTLWRRRHPVISPHEYLQDLQDQARWN